MICTSPDGWLKSSGVTKYCTRRAVIRRLPSVLTSPDGNTKINLPAQAYCSQHMATVSSTMIVQMRRGAVLESC